MVHLIEFCGHYVALDVESGSVHAIDRTAMSVLTFKNAGKTNEMCIRDSHTDGSEGTISHSPQADIAWHHAAY